MNALIVRLRLLEPVLATQPQIGEPNSGVSLGYIAGSMIRGAAVGEYLAQRGKRAVAGDSEDDKDRFHRLFLSGAVRFLNAYPEGPYTGSRMLPRPLSWLVEKDKLNNRQAPISDAACAPPQLENPKAPKGDFVWWDGAHVELHSLKRQSALHNASENRNRKEEGASQVYRYEALAPGQVLVAAVVADKSADLEAIAPALRGIRKLGGSRTGGYGGVAVESVRLVANWSEYTRADERADVNDGESEFLQDHLIVTLLSDAVLRSVAGQPGVGLGEYLSAEWGLPEPPAAFQRLRLVGGFNRTAGLPLPQAWAVEAGSVLVYQRTPQVEATLAPLVTRGVGERLAEGFGRLALDWQAATQINQHDPAASAAAGSPSVALSPTGRDMAALMAGRQLETHLQQEMVAQINRLLPGFTRLPSAAQLARVQLAARRAYLDADLQIVEKHFEDLKSAKVQWEATEDGKKLCGWIIEQTQLNRAGFEQQFHLAGNLPNVAGVDAELTDEVRARTVARLIEELLRQAVKRKRRAADEETGATNGEKGVQRT